MWLELQIFGFRALWSPYYMLFLIGLVVLYHLFTVTFRHKFTLDGPPPTARQYTYFLLGMVLLYVIKGSPIDLISHIMFTAHMIQMVIYLFVLPVLLIKGIPVWVWEKIFSTKIIGSVLNILTKPLVAMIVFNALFSFYHIPLIFDFAKSNNFIHGSISTILLFGAFLMWWVLICPIKDRDSLSPMLKFAYLIGNSVLITPACALIIFANHSFYATYNEAANWVQMLALCVPESVLQGLSLTGPEMFSPIAVDADQQLGGIVMKISQETIYSFVLASLFFKRFTDDSNKVDPLPSTSSAGPQTN